jgi:hypothetical protein
MARDWIALTLISLGGAAAWVGLLPWMERHPLVMPPDLYDRLTGYGASKKPFAGLMDFTPVALGLVIVTVCCLIYGRWMEWSTSRPIGSRKRT